MKPKSNLFDKRGGKESRSALDDFAQMACRRQGSTFGADRDEWRQALAVDLEGHREDQEVQGKPFS